METLETTCWADPLTRAERRQLELMLARACNRSYLARFIRPADTIALQLVSADMSDLHLDVTERAA